MCALADCADCRKRVDGTKDIVWIPSPPTKKHLIPRVAYWVKQVWWPGTRSDDQQQLHTLSHSIRQHCTPAVCIRQPNVCNEIVLLCVCVFVWCLLQLLLSLALAAIAMRVFPCTDTDRTTEREREREDQANMQYGSCIRTLVLSFSLLLSHLIVFECSLKVSVGRAMCNVHAPSCSQ